MYFLSHSSKQVNKEGAKPQLLEKINTYYEPSNYEPIILALSEKKINCCTAKHLVKGKVS